MKRYNQLRQQAIDSSVQGDVLTMTPLDSDPHITSIIHAIAALCEALIGASGGQDAAGEGRVGQQ